MTSKRTEDTEYTLDAPMIFEIATRPEADTNPGDEQIPRNVRYRERQYSTFPSHQIGKSAAKKLRAVVASVATPPGLTRRLNLLRSYPSIP